MLYRSDKDAVYAFIVYIGYLYHNDINSNKFTVSSVTKFCNDHQSVLRDFYLSIVDPEFSYYEFQMECYNSLCHCLTMTA